MLDFLKLKYIFKKVFNITNIDSCSKTNFKINEEAGKVEIKNPEVLDYIAKIIDEGKNILITGSAGTGKSFILSHLREKYNIDITSTTGISAINIKGQTIHSWSGIGLCNKPINEIVKRILGIPTLYHQINRCKILAIDEISMLDAKTMDYLDEVLKEVRGNLKPFGGIQVLLFGDFFQLPPVKEENGFSFESKAWYELEVTPIILEKVYRQDDLEFINVLSNSRLGDLTTENIRLFYNREVDFETNQTNILHIFSTNKEADGYNSWKFEQINNPAHKYLALDKIYQHKSDGSVNEILVEDNNTDKFLNKTDLKSLDFLDKNCKAPRLLELKEGCKVMLLKNLNFEKNLVNGSTGTIQNITENNILVDFDNGISQIISKNKFEYYNEGVLKAVREQYPLRLAYGITIHKSQGMTLDNVVINFNKIFAYGQAYVALSRTRALNGLHLKNFNPNKIIANKKIIDFYRALESINLIKEA